MNRILVINVNWVGDVLFSTPFLEALRKAFPKSYIASLVVPSCREVLEGNPHLNEILIYDERGRHRFLWGKLELVQMLKAKRFDRAYLLHRSFTRRLLTVLAGIPERIGYAIKWKGFLLTQKIPPPALDLHKVELFLGLLPEAMRGGNRNYTLKVSQEEEETLDRLLESKGMNRSNPYVVLCPFGNWNQKRWPPERFAALGDALADRTKRQIVIAGAAKDHLLGERIAAVMKTKPVLLCGETSLRQLAALLKRATLVVSNDTGPMHVAQSQGTKVVALFGPTHPNLTGPSGDAPKIILRKEVGCNDDPPCYYVDCPDNICMKAIQLEEVLDAIEKNT